MLEEKKKKPILSKTNFFPKFKRELDIDEERISKT